MHPHSGLLTASNLGRQSPSGNWLVRNVSLCLKPNQAVALVGPSGGGKTVLLRSLGMLDPMNEGTLTWRGQAVPDVDVPRFRRECIYLHQRIRLGEGTVEEVLRGPFAFSQNADATFDAQRVLTWLAPLQRDASFLQKSVSTISGGESQIVALLRAMQLDPMALLLDEPTSALDGDTSIAIEELLRAWQQMPGKNRSYVWVSHDRRQADRISTAQWRMRNGVVSEVAA